MSYTIEKAESLTGVDHVVLWIPGTGQQAVATAEGVHWVSSASGSTPAEARDPALAKTVSTMLQTAAFESERLANPTTKETE